MKRMVCFRVLNKEGIRIEDSEAFKQTVQQEGFDNVTVLERANCFSKKSIRVFETKCKTKYQKSGRMKAIGNIWEKSAREQELKFINYNNSPQGKRVNLELAKEVASSLSMKELYEVVKDVNEYESEYRKVCSQEIDNRKKMRA